MSISARPASLVTRVTLLVGLTTIASLILLGVFVQEAIEQHLMELEIEELHVITDAIQETLDTSTYIEDRSSFVEGLERTVSGHHGVYFMVADSLGDMVYSTPGLDLAAISETIQSTELISTETLHSWVDNAHRYSGVLMEMSPSLTSRSPDTYRVTVAVAMDEHLNFLSGFHLSLWTIIAGICLFAILAAWVAARQAHIPIRRLSARIRNISSDRLNERLDESKVPAELNELVKSFNVMIVRMEEVFEKLSHFSADIAHEFRTPITNIITQTQVSLGQARDVDEYREILYSNLEEYERMAKMVSDMLFLAQTDNGLIKPTFAQLNLQQEIKGLFDFFEALAEEKGVELQLSGRCTPILGDKSMLRRAFSNLISNALTHTESNRQIKVFLEPEAGSVSVSIENPGPAIAAKHLPRIFDRFYQDDQSRRREGAGLGLAIVKSIIELHNGSVSVQSADNRTCFRITLPGI